MEIKHDFKGRLFSADDVRAYALAGNAILTLKSSITGGRHTYKIRKKNDTELWYVSALTGSDNDKASSYSYMGSIQNGQYRHGWSRAKVPTTSQSHKVFDWFWKLLATGPVLHKDLEVWHEGRCGRCGRKLTVPESISRGLGPECSTIVGSRHDPR
jgi:hypothetical protein